MSPKDTWQHVESALIVLLWLGWAEVVLAVSSQLAEDVDADKRPTVHRAAPIAKTVSCVLWLSSARVKELQS